MATMLVRHVLLGFLDERQLGVDSVERAMAESVLANLLRQPSDANVLSQLLAVNKC
jgi:hypothetical protein